MILYAGSYTEMITENFGGCGEGIYCFDFDPVSGGLQLKHITAAVNPSYLSIPSSGYLYTHTEVLAEKKPVVQAYKINKNDSSLQLINEQAIPGGCPCYIHFSKKNNCILVACYETGNTILYPIAKDGTVLPMLKKLEHAGSSVNKLRQESAHAHAVITDEIFNNILITDLGTDQVMVYQASTFNKKLEVKLIQAVSMPPGSGPRHIILHAETNHAYVLNELTATVNMMRYCNGYLTAGFVCNTLPTYFKAIPGAAAIRISGDGKFIYTSERSDNAISILRVDSEKETLELTGRQDTLSKTPRDFILDPTGNWLLVVNQDSDSITIFKADKNSGYLDPVNLIEDIKSPACLHWLP